MYRLTVLVGAVLLLLAACGIAPSQGSSGEVRYYTTEGVAPMSWQLDVYTPDKSSLRATYKDTSPGGIVGGYQWSLRGDGAPLQMRWRAIPSSVDIRPRDIVQLTVDGQPAFFGVVTRSWPGDESDMREYIALGGIELLRYRSHVDPTSYPEQDVAAIARQVISTYRHPAVTYDAALIPDTGSTIAMPMAYRLEVGEILDTLARSVSSLGVSWGVDAQGRAFFGARTTSETVGYETADLRWEPEAGDEVVTRVDLVLATQLPNTQQLSDWREEDVGGTVNSSPAWQLQWAPIVVSVATSNDAKYGVQRTYAASGLLREVTGSGWDANQLDNAANAWDGNMATYASNNNNAGTYVNIYSGSRHNIYGGGLYFELQETASLKLELQFDWTNPLNGAHESVARWTDYIEYQSGGYKAQILSLPPTRPLELGVPYTMEFVAYFSEILGAGKLRVYEAYVVEADVTAAREYAQSLLRAPTQRPASIRWQRYHAPVSIITVDGAPSGALMHSVREWRYLWTPERIETTAMLGGRADDDVTRAINRAVSLGHGNALRVARGLTEVR